jgi:hypothetical protein
MKIVLNKYFVPFTLFTCIIIFSGCEKVIDLKLDNSEPLLVIEGSVSNQLEYQIVRISKTIPFGEKNRFNPVSGAKVTLSSSDGKGLSYTEVSPGIYQGDPFRGISGVKYTLNVLADGKTYTASSIVPQPVKLDSLTLKQFSFFGDTNTFIAANYTDPPSVQNQYRYIVKVKSKVEHEAVTEDRFNDGNSVVEVIFYELDDLKKGDRVDVEMQCIDRKVFKYFFALNQIGGSDGPPVAPANPVSNFSNGALGIFNAHTSTKRSLVIK